MIKKVEKIWRDPVWSKVIAWSIIGLISILLVAIQSWVENTSFLESAQQIFAFLIETNISLNLLTLILIGSGGLIIFRILIKRVIKKRPKIILRRKEETDVEKEMKAIKAEHKKEQELKILSAIKDYKNLPEKAIEIFRHYGYFNENIKEFIFTYKDQIDPELYKQLAIRV